MALRGSSIADLCSALLLQHFHQSKLMGAWLANTKLKERDVVLDSSDILSEVKRK
jgi:hypothetical protein